MLNKLKRPSYVSLETVLFNKNIIFQDFSKIITSVSSNSYVEKIEKIEYRYLKIKNEILTNPIGIINEDKVHIATAERAICDVLYFNKKFYFDNLNDINKELLLKISQIYNKRVIKEVKEICSI